MKKVILSAMVVLVTMISSYAQAQDFRPKQFGNSSAQSGTAFTYQLVPTTNNWTFIKLNTRTGQMWHVQYSIDDSNPFQYILSLKSLVEQENEKDGRFVLYPTTNSYNFILLDSIDGRVWQVQWNMDAEKRLVIPIE